MTQRKILTLLAVLSWLRIARLLRTPALRSADGFDEPAARLQLQRAVVVVLCALVTVADQLLQGKEVTPDLTIEGLGKADVDMEKKVIRFNKILEVTKDNAQSLGF